MAGRVGYHVGGNAARVMGKVLRAGYGPMWGIAWAVAHHGRAPRHASDAVALASLIWAFELAVLPCVGATPPLRSWPRADIASDGVNCLAFATTYTCVIALMGRPGSAANR